MSRTIRVDVDLFEFDDRGIIDELLSRRLVTVAEHKVLCKRGELRLSKDDRRNDLLSDERKLEAYEDCVAFIDEAAWRVRRGDLREALIFVERAFPELVGIARI